VNGGYFYLAKQRGKVFAGAASRFVIDFAQPGGAWFNCSTGEGGEPSSAYFGNLTDGWYRHEYFRTERAQSPEGVTGGKRLVLAP
jgi:acyl-homoserine lactone acylase PvdQ